MVGPGLGARVGTGSAAPRAAPSARPSATRSGAASARPWASPSRLAGDALGAGVGGTVGPSGAPSGGRRRGERQQRGLGRRPRAALGDEDAAVLARAPHAAAADESPRLRIERATGTRARRAVLVARALHQVARRQREVGAGGHAAPDVGGRLRGDPRTAAASIGAGPTVEATPTLWRAASQEATPAGCGPAAASFIGTRATGLACIWKM